jgi:hypothetical protein
MRLIALVMLLGACRGEPPVGVVCRAGAPSEVAAQLAAELGADGWADVRVHVGRGRTNVVARRGARSYSALLASDACGTRVTATTVVGSGANASEVGPGGAGPTRL